MSQRYFRSSVAVYEAVRANLDAAFGHPNAETQTCIEPAETGVRDSLGRMLFAADAPWCEWPQVAAVLPELLSSGSVEEIDEATYQGVWPPLPR
jgi:hypothetical protein